MMRKRTGGIKSNVLIFINLVEKSSLSFLCKQASRFFLVFYLTTFNIELKGFSSFNRHFAICLLPSAFCFLPSSIVHRPSPVVIHSALPACQSICTAGRRTQISELITSPIRDQHIKAHLSQFFCQGEGRLFCFERSYSHPMVFLCLGFYRSHMNILKTLL